MLTLLIAAIVIAASVGVLSLVGIGTLAVELSKLLVVCAMVLILILAVVGVARGRTRA